MNFSFHRWSVFRVPYGLFLCTRGEGVSKVNQSIAFGALDLVSCRILVPHGVYRPINHRQSLASRQVPRLPTECSD